MNWTKTTKNPIAATFTPLNADFTINHGLIPIYIDYLLGIGVNEVFVNGTSGECMSLTVDERKAVAETWIVEGRQKLNRIIIQCGAGNLEDTKALAAHASTLQADGIAFTPPTYFKPCSIDDLIDFCSDVCKCVPNTPVLYYHIPGVTGVAFNMCDFFGKLVQGNKIPNLVGCKFTSIDLADAIQTSLIDNGRYDVILGAESVNLQKKILLGALAMGLKGSIGASYSVCGALINKLIKCFDNNDLAAAQIAQYDVQRLFNMCARNETPNSPPLNVNELIASFKYSMKLIHPKLDFGPVRLPLKAPSQAKMERVKKLLMEFNII